MNKNCKNCGFERDEYCINEDSADYNEPVNEYMICLRWIEKAEKTEKEE